MSVRLRKDGRWQLDIVIWREGKRVRIKKSARAKNKQEALAAERKERTRLEAGGGTGPAPLFSDFAREFLEVCTMSNKPSELAAKRMMMRKHLGPFFGVMRLDRIGAEQLEKYKASKLAGDKPMRAKSINNHLTCLRRMFSVAVKWKRVQAVPEIVWLKKTTPEIVFFGFDEAARLVEAAPDEWRAMILVALRTGLRRGELLALRWEDVDLSAGRIVVRRSAVNGIIGTPKNGRTREVPLSDEAAAALRSLPSRLRHALVFCTPKGRMFTPSEVWTGLHRATRAAGLRTVGWHSCRHSFASHLVMRGVALKAVQELLGHATIEMTMRYAHLSPGVRRDAVRLLDGPVSGNGGDAPRSPETSQGTFRERSEAV